MRSSNLLALAVLALAPFSLTSYAQEHQHAHSLEAHQHGVATLNIALEDQQLVLELHSPAINIIGFEYQPSADTDKHAVLTAEHTLKNEQRLFKLSAAAQCALSSVAIENDLAEHSDDHQQSAHDEDEQQHSDIRASYQFNCAVPTKLTSIDLDGFFKAFPLTEKIHVQLISAGTQQGVELSQGNTAINW